MSRVNVKLVRESVRRFAAGDLSGLAGLYTPDVVVVAPPGWPETGRFEGRDAAIGQLTRVQEDWAHQTMEVQKERAERDWVVIEILWTVQGAGSGVPGQVTVIAACRVADRQIDELRYFWEWDDALQAAGMRD
jgi:ketosteroid isomerase-like protein